MENNERQRRNARPSSSPVPKEREAQISKMLDEYDVKPHPPLPIPDDPPPHEGAMIGFDHIVEPPDLVIVEVLEALPGRPISGERIVKPDGTISLGFYGEVYVRGMTLDASQSRDYQTPQDLSERLCTRSGRARRRIRIRSASP